MRQTLEPSNLENAYYRLPPQKVMLGILVLEWSPRSTTVRWANAVLTAHATDRVIIVTHAFLYHDSTRYDWAANGVVFRQITELKHGGDVAFSGSLGDPLALGSQVGRAT